MSEAHLKGAAYRRLSRAERRYSDRPLVDSIAAMQRLLPQGEARFEARLARALATAAERGDGFYLGGFAAQRALGRELIVDIDPSTLTERLEHRFKQGERACNIRDKFLGAGDWTPLVWSFERSSTYREMAEIVQAGFDYRRTRSYLNAVERASAGDPVNRNFVLLSSPAKVEAYFRKAAEMCRSINDVGLIRRSDYGRRLSSFASPSVRLPWIEFGEVDIGIAIGAAGEFYRFASGKHRTAAAQALKLTSMSVEIRLVHAKWLARQMAETGLCPLAALRRGIETLPRTAR